jgi:hypothetical protein
MVFNLAYDYWYIKSFGSIDFGQVLKHSAMSIALEVVLAGSLYLEYTKFKKSAIGCLGDYQDFALEFSNENQYRVMAHVSIFVVIQVIRTQSFLCKCR